MANNISSNPWYIDTVGTVWPTRAYIKQIVWNKPTAGSPLVILDMNGNTLINTVANASDPMFTFGGLGWVNGFVVTTLGTGTLSVGINK